MKNRIKQKYIKCSNSYITRYFLKIFIAVIILVIILVAGITCFSQRATEQEIIGLHSSILHQAIKQPAGMLRDVKSVLQKLTETNRVIDWISSEDEDVVSVDSFVQNEIFDNFKLGSKFRIYLYDETKLRYTSELLANKFEENRLRREELEKVYRFIEEKVRNQVNDEMFLYAPVKAQERGIYRYSAYLFQPIKDLLTSEIKGMALMQISETLLFDSFSDLIEEGRDYCIINKDGVVISANDKQRIGKEYDQNELKIENQERLGAGHGTSKRFPSYMYFYENISGSDWYLVENVNIKNMFTPVRCMMMFSVALVMLFILCFLPIIRYSLSNVLQPIAIIKEKMNRVAQGDMHTYISEEEKGKGEFSEIAESFNYMVDKLESQVNEIRNIERKRHLTELDFLQTQINPHFIYNTLSSIRFYVEMGKNDEAEQMLIGFSKILRKTLSNSEKFVSLEEEIETLSYYIDLQKLRYRDRFEVKFILEKDTLKCIVPDFILQPIVENAIFYSLAEKPVCHIEIKSHRVKDVLILSVKDDGVGMDKERLNMILEKAAQMNKVGLRNVNERLKLNFGEQYGIRIISEKGIGTEIIMEMPIAGERKQEV